MIRGGRLLAMARKEALQLRRDPRSLVLAFVLPFALVLLFGAAISLDVREIPFAVADHDRSPASRALVDAFTASGYFRFDGLVEDRGQVDHLLARGRVRMVLVIPPGYARDLAAGQAVVQGLVDGGDANTATIAINYADGILEGAGRAGGQLSIRRVLPVRTEARVWYNEALESARMIVPGLVAVIMAIIAAMLTALTIAREWERGTMEQLAATPVRRFEVVFGKLLPYVAIGVVDVAMATVLGWLVFDVPVRGSLLELALLSLLFLVGVLSWGIFLSARLKSQMLATQFAIMTTYLPTLLLSGFIFSLANMPWVLQAISYIIPARYFIVITRGIFLKDIGLTVLWPQALGLVAFALLTTGAAVASFRKELA